MVKITAEQLKAIIPSAKKTSIDKYLPAINDSIKNWSNVAAAAFVAQIAHESGSLNYVKEIASGAAYEGRVDLGNRFKGDGMKFKGRGLIQITGRSSYKECSIHIFGNDVLLDKPEILEEPKAAVLSAVWFWNRKKLSSIMDNPKEWVKAFKGKNYDKFEWVTLLINGGQNGLAERKAFFSRAIKVLDAL